jgi:hypothetical protein
MFAPLQADRLEGTLFGWDIDVDVLVRLQYDWRRL